MWDWDRGKQSIKHHQKSVILRQPWCSVVNDKLILLGLSCCLSSGCTIITPLLLQEQPCAGWFLMWECSLLLHSLFPGGSLKVLEHQFSPTSMAPHRRQHGGMGNKGHIKMQETKSICHNFHHQDCSPQLSNQWLMPNSISKRIDTALKTRQCQNKQCENKLIKTIQTILHNL